MTPIQMIALNAGLAVLMYGLLFLLYRLLRRRIRLLSRSPIVMQLLFILLPLNLLLSEPLARIHAKVPEILLAALIFMGVQLIIRLLDVWLFDLLFASRKTVNVPVVVRDICRWLLSAVALLIIIRSLFPEVNLNVLAVSSIVVGYILGNATQDTLGNLVSGLALNTESPFAIGDWVTIAGHTGQIVDMTWRATSLRTKAGDYITIPNASIARETITNYSQPTTVHGCNLEVGVNYGVPPAKVMTTLMDAIRSVPEVIPAPVPRIRLIRYSDFSVDYNIKFYINDFERMEDISSQIMERIWYFFKRNDIVIPFPIRDVNMRQITAQDDALKAEADRARKAGLLNSVDLFRPLDPETRQQLAMALVEHMYGPGEVIVEQGSAGSTFYAIVSGSVDVSVMQNSRRTSVATLSAGAFFGEMSFLTGEKTNATITACGDCTVLALSHTELSGILAANSSLADDFAVVLARRQQEAAQRLTQNGQPKSGPGGARDMVSSSAIGSRIRRFFGISDK